VVNLATGNLQLVHPVCGWGGKGGGISFALTFNSQSARSSSLGPKWTHSYNWQVLSQSNQAIVLAGDGTETVFTLSAGKQLCLSQAAAKHARALQRCAEDLKKCIDDCTKDAGQPPEVREPVLPRLPRPFLPPGVSIGPVDGGFGIKWSFSF
jgi:hypothetical protein